MKPIGKYTKSAPVRESADEPKPPAVCGRCKYSFADGKRAQINIPRTNIIRCSDCLEAELFRAGKHSKSGTDAEDLYRQGVTTWLI